MQPYRARKPQASPLWQCLSKHFDAFLDVYEERYQARYGFLRPVIPSAVAEFLKCGDLREGFARVRCADCGHSRFVAFSCKQRCVCPSCHQKRALRTALHVEGEVRAAVAHRQFVFTMPKRFRLYFRFNRDLLRKLPPLAWATIRDVHRAVLNRRDLVPGVIVSIQTHGELAHWHPHLHALVTDGAFTPDGQFIPMPDIPTEPQECVSKLEGAARSAIFAESKAARQENPRQRALTAKPTPESAKMASAHRVAPILAIGCVVATGRGRWRTSPRAHALPTGPNRQQRDPLEF